MFKGRIAVTCLTAHESRRPWRVGAAQSHIRKPKSPECSGGQKAGGHLVPAPVVSSGSSGTRWTHIPGESSTPRLVLPSQSHEKLEAREGRMWEHAMLKADTSRKQHMRRKVECPMGKKLRKTGSRFISTSFQGTGGIAFS